MIELNNSDTRQAYYSAENNMQKLRDGIATNGWKLSAEKLDVVYKNHVNHEAIKLGMGSTADGMKLLGAEIEELYISLLEIEQRYQQSHNQYSQFFSKQ